MSKNKKKKDKKGGKSKGGVTAKTAKVGARLRALTQNPLVADLVAATLVAAAAALKDTKKAHQLAATAEKDLEELGRKGAHRGNALWQLALDVGRKSLEALGGDEGTRPARAKPKAAPAKPRKSSAAAKPAKSKTSGRKSPKK